jgi:hypothetical protein
MFNSAVIRDAHKQNERQMHYVRRPEQTVMLTSGVSYRVEHSQCPKWRDNETPNTRSFFETRGISIKSDIVGGVIHQMLSITFYFGL